MGSEGAEEPLSSAFERPRYLLGFSDRAGEGLAGRVGRWLEASGLAVEAEGAAEAGWAFLVVGAGREQLERAADGLGYLKAHASLPPHVKGQGLGKIEFERGSSNWRKGYEGYTGAEFWLPCERAQLLRALLEALPVPEGLCGAHGKAASRVSGDQWLPKLAPLAERSPSGSLLAALRSAGLLESASPMHGSNSERLGVWRAGALKALAPVDAVQRYFGSQVAMYFAWTNCFTRWLLLPAGAGLACSAHMRLSGSTVDDDPLIPFYSLLVVLWGVAFVCGWQRECAEHAWRWNDLFERRSERVRPEFRGALRRSPVTGAMERHFPPWQRFWAYCRSVAVTTGMLCVAFFVMVCSLNLQGYMEEHNTSLERLFYIRALARYADPGSLFDPDQTEYFGLLAYVPALLHVLVIMQLNKLYRHISEWLTENENHRLEEDHENSLIAKRFIFEAFDCYISLFYVGFVQQDVRKLRSELSQLYTMDSIRRVLCETGLPLLAKVFGRQRGEERYAALKKSDSAHHAEALDQLEQAEYERFDDFLEMVIEFGYITLFASAFPLASVLSIACNLIEIKSDLFKLTRVYKRPVATRAATIGTWLHVIQVLVFLSIPTNVMLFSMSEQLASWAPSLYREATRRDVARGRVGQMIDAASGDRDLVMRRGRAKYVVFIAALLEHIVGLVALLLMWAIPKRPEWVANEVARLEFHKEEQARALRASIAKNEAATLDQ